MRIVESVYQVRLSTKPMLVMGGFFLLAYAIGQLVINLLDLQVPEYKLYTFDNSLRVLLISSSIFLAIISCRNIIYNKIIVIKGCNILYIYILILPITIYLCFQYPWGNFGGEVTLGHSIKALFRHVYTVVSLLFLLRFRKTLTLLILIDIFLLFIDPSRLFFVETIFPKLYLYIIINKVKIKFRHIALAALLILILMYIQIFRLESTSENFVLFSLYSDIMHASYPALQLSQFSIDFPWTVVNIQNLFITTYSENLSPLGGFFLPGSFFLSGNILVDIFLAYLITLLFTKLYSFLSSKNLNIILFSGIVFAINKMEIINTLKILLILYILYYFISKFSNVTIRNI